MDELFNTSTLFTLSGDQKHKYNPFQVPEPKARLPLNIPRLTTDELFNQQSVTVSKAPKRNKRYSTEQTEALNNIAKQYKIDPSALKVKRSFDVLKVSYNHESKMAGVEGIFKMAWEIKRDGTVLKKKTKIKG